MSANLPPSFKPIAHYIKIANENASRDPVIYYWSLLYMALAPDITNTTKFNESTWSRLQQQIRTEKESIEKRDQLREYLDDVNGEMMNHQKIQEISTEIQHKTVSCEALRLQIAKLNQKVLNGKRKIEELNEKLEKKDQDELKLERKVKTLEIQNQENQMRKKKEKRAIEIMIRLNSYRKLAMIKEIFEIFELKIDGGPADLGIIRNCNCQVVDSIRGLHLPQLLNIFHHPEAPTITALQNLIHLFDVICRVLNFAPSFPIKRNFHQIYNPMDNKMALMTEKSWKKRVDRERFIEGISWLGKDISQLRESCGIPTMATDRCLGTLEEWIRLVVQKKTVFQRPICSVFSPANLLIGYEIL